MTLKDIRHCHGFVDRDAGVAGWKYLHPSKNHLWGVYVPDDGRLGEERRKKEGAEAERLAKETANCLELTALTREPWRVVNTPQLTLDNLPGGAIYVVKSAKGTNKTNALSQFKFKISATCIEYYGRLAILCISLSLGLRMSSGGFGNVLGAI